MLHGVRLPNAYFSVQRTVNHTTGEANWVLFQTITTVQSAIRVVSKAFFIVQPSTAPFSSAVCKQRERKASVEAIMHLLELCC